MDQRHGHEIGNSSHEYVHALEMGCLRGACGVTRWEQESNESVYERCGMSTYASELNCGVSKRKHIGLIERMGSEEFVKVYGSELEGPNRKGRPLGSWRHRVEEYVGERGIGGGEVLEQARFQSCFFNQWVFCRGGDGGLTSVIIFQILNVVPGI